MVWTWFLDRGAMEAARICRYVTTTLPLASRHISGLLIAPPLRQAQGDQTFTKRQAQGDGLGRQSGQQILPPIGLPLQGCPKQESAGQANEKTVTPSP